MLEKFVKSKIITDGRLYLDYSATGKGYSEVEDYISQLLPHNCNVHSETGVNVELFKKEEKLARNRIKKALNVDGSYYIIQTGSGATSAIKKFLEIKGIYISPAAKRRVTVNSNNLPVVIIGSYEHHSNELSFREGLCEVRKVRLSKDLGFDLENLKEILNECSGREIIGSFTVASNVTGVITPYKEIYKMIKEHGGTVCLDVATSLSHMNVERGYYDVMFCSPHKLIGGVASCGLLIIKKNMCNPADKPTFSGGGTVYYVSRGEEKYIPDIEQREHAGSINIYALIRASLALELRDCIGIKDMQRHENELKEYFFSRYSEVSGITLYANKNRNRLSIFAFNIDGIYHKKLTAELSKKYKIETRCGCSCAGPYGHELLSLDENYKFMDSPGWVRVGFNITHTKDDVDYLIASLKEITKTVKN